METNDILYEFRNLKISEINPNIFISNDKQEQEVCNFMLSLALLYNDFKDLVWLSKNLISVKPKEPVEKNSYNGHYGGLVWHLERLYYSLMRELFKIICENIESIKHEMFIETERKLGKEVKTCWQSIIDISNEVNSDNKSLDEESKLLKEIFMRIRNNLGYHFAPKEIMNGYKTFFKSENGKAEESYISLGNSLSKRRFYFADAAVEGCFKNIVGKNHEMLSKTFQKVIENVNDAIYEIVINFITVRKGCFRDVR
ncbi:MAG: hypothetical protein WC947_10250 [Elusimicrobiota bacterium]